MRQGNSTDLLGASDPRAASIGIIYVAPADDRTSVLAAILTQEKLGRKQVAVVLPNPNKAFQRPVDFDDLKAVRRKLLVIVIFIAAAGSDIANFARQRRFRVYTSLESYADALHEQESSNLQEKAEDEPPLIPKIRRAIIPKTRHVFFCYAHEDEGLLDQLKAHLMALQRQKLIDTWHDRNINAGTERKNEIDFHLNRADIILLLISPDFMASDYCYSVEMIHAMARHEHGDACVIPIILRPVYWQGAPFGKLQVLPKDAKPITSSRHHSLDEAFFDVAEGIRETVEKLRGKEA